MTVFENLEISIQVNEQNLQEYEDITGEQAPREISRYVEARSGAPFVVKITVPSEFEVTADGLLFQVLVDGFSIQETLYMPKPERKSQSYDKIVRGKEYEEDGLWKLRPLSFSEIKEGESSSYCVTGC